MQQCIVMKLSVFKYKQYSKPCLPNTSNLFRNTKQIKTKIIYSKILKNRENMNNTLKL